MFNCNLCDETFNSRPFMEEHTERNHTSRLTYFMHSLWSGIQHECDETFNSRPSLEDHTDRNHTSQLTYVCTVCDQAFSYNVNWNFTKNTLTLPLLWVNHIVNDHVCTICDKKFVKKDDLEKHIQDIHCEFCSECFNSKEIMDPQM